MLLLLPIMSAVQVDMNHEIKQGDVLVAKISGNFLQPILKNNVYFHRGYVAVPFEFELLKIEQDYFIYTSTLGKIPGNYTITIKEAEYYIEGGQTSTDDLVINFSILEDYADFSVKPGALIADGAFSLELQNLKDTELTIYIDKNASQEQQGFFSFLSGVGTPTGQAHTLKAGESKQVTLEFENIPNATLRTVQLSTDNFSTEIFVYALSNVQEIVNETNQTEVNETEVNQTGTNETVTINETDVPPISQTCEEINGSICERGQKCSAEQITAQDGICCIGKCVEKKRSKTGQIIGWTIIIILIGLYIWFYFKKYKKAKKKVDLLKVAEGKK